MSALPKLHPQARERPVVAVSAERSQRYENALRERVREPGPGLTANERCEAKALFARLGLPDKLGQGLRGLRVLECGCGNGWFSIWLAEQGAQVTAIDIEEEALDRTWSRALAEGQVDRLQVRLTSLHKLNLGDESFDLVVGRLVLHHGDIEKAALEIRRVLRPGGQAAFEENSSRNPLLMATRSAVRLIRGLGPKSPDPQYPLSEEEVRTLARVFGGRLKRSFPELALFRLLGGTVIDQRLSTTSRALRAVDRRLSSLLPFLNGAGFLQSLWMERP